MAMIVRDPRFSMSAAPSAYAQSAEQPPRRQPRVSFGKRLNRQITNVWKLFTNTRGRQRASVYSSQFVTLTSRRRSTIPTPIVRLNA
ncbi:hypothetical protein CC2G_011826 [Coprinopsis cinerea AmutBmut pab1-1]|nr:hypothetical protein CC2G_011826 [Coprinopsis cinerea AmutBmut pab1-1]